MRAVKAAKNSSPIRGPGVFFKGITWRSQGVIGFLLETEAQGRPVSKGMFWPDPWDGRVLRARGALPVRTCASKIVLLCSCCCTNAGACLCKMRGLNRITFQIGTGTDLVWSCGRRCKCLFTFIAGVWSCVPGHSVVRVLIFIRVSGGLIVPPEAGEQAQNKGQYE